jgi:hypothetical protein
MRYSDIETLYTSESRKKGFYLRCNEQKKTNLALGKAIKNSKINRF